MRLREAVEQRISAMSEKDRAAESRSICRRILQELPEDLSAVCLYVPLKTEVDIRPLFQEFRSLNVPIYLPRFEAGLLLFRRGDDPSNLGKGALGIPEPLITAELLPQSGSIIILVPGRAFDHTGGRLGRGNGGYDRFIRSYRSANIEVQFWGICFECQIVREVPREEHDEILDAVITARGKGVRDS